MLEERFGEVYIKFKLHFYQKVFEWFQQREATLTTVEAFCMEIIHALDHPTINEFATFAHISPPNTAYKINSLINKGYIRKLQSEKDKREYYLEVTQKYYDYYNISYSYMQTVMQRVQDRLTLEETATFERILSMMSDELMPELPALHHEDRV